MTPRQRPTISRHRAARALAVVAATALLATACGSDDDAGPGAVPEPPGTDPAPPTTTIPGRGWIDGEPEWNAAGGTAEGDVAYASADEPAVEHGRELSSEDAVALPVEPDGGIGDGAGAPVDQSPLRAGSVDDNVDYQGFLAYLDRLEELGFEGRPLDSTRRTTLTVRGANGLPVPGIEVTATAGTTATLRTTADGTVRYHPGFYGADAATVTFSVDGAETTVDVGGDATISLDRPGGVEGAVPLDVLFLLDATGSMGDEIGRLKATIDTVADRVSGLDPRPDVRFAMTLYRDEGDAFVTSTFDFTGDVQEFRDALDRVVAGGGGDYPEALDEGLAEALAAPAWRSPDEAVQLVFLVADAPPQVQRQVPTPYTDSIVDAVGRGIKIFPVASSESDDVAELVFRQMAQATGAPFVFLSYGAGGAATGERTDIESTDYEELALDELVVRLIAEEMADLNGPDAPPPTVPPTTAPPTTNPPGQEQPTPPSGEVGVADIARNVEYYGACGNEVLVSDAGTFYPLLPAQVDALDTAPYDAAAASIPTETLLRVAPPGPGDDIGTLVVFDDGIARFESDSGWVIWLSDTVQDYDWEC